MVRHTVKVLHHLLQDFQSVSDHFGILCNKKLKGEIWRQTKTNKSREIEKQ